jgi:hypothetical protein
VPGNSCAALRIATNSELPTPTAALLLPDATDLAWPELARKSTAARPTAAYNGKCASSFPNNAADVLRSPDPAMSQC